MRELNNEIKIHCGRLYAIIAILMLRRFIREIISE